MSGKRNQVLQTYARCPTARLRRTTPFAAKNYLSTYKKIAAYSKHCKLKWKPDISEEVRELIQGMLHPKPAQRLGNTTGGIDELKGQRWFEPLDWDKLYRKEVRYCVHAGSISHLYCSQVAASTQEGDNESLTCGVACLPQLPAPFTPEVKDSTDLTYFNPEGAHAKQRSTLRHTTTGT